MAGTTPNSDAFFKNMDPQAREMLDRLGLGGSMEIFLQMAQMLQQNGVSTDGQNLDQNNITGANANASAGYSVEQAAPRRATDLAGPTVN